MEYRNARGEDMGAVAQLFSEAFPDSVEHTMGGEPPPLGLLADAFHMCLDVDPDGFFVAADDTGRLAGYIIAPVAVNRIWRRALSGGYAWRWIGDLLAGRLRFTGATVRIAVNDKLAFWRSQKIADEIHSRILSIGVAPWARGQRIGGELLDRAIARFRISGVHRVRLEVRPWNTPAVRLYDRRGFRVVGRTRDTQGEWLILVLEL